MTQYITVAPDDRVEARNGVIKLHGPEAFKGMRRAGNLAGGILDALVPHVVPGVSTQELDDIVHRLTLDAGDSIIGVWDASRLDQVLCNLLSNAIKYGDGKPIEVSAWSADGWAHVSVKDRGIGISKGDQERIFAPYSRAVSSHHISGLGLGLWIAQQIVRSSGGNIRVESKLGSGSRFTIDLPIRYSCKVS